MARMLRFLSPLFLGWLAILAVLTAALAAGGRLTELSLCRGLLDYLPQALAVLLFLLGLLVWDRLDTALALGGRRGDFYRASRLWFLGLTLASWGLLRGAAALLPGELPASWAVLTSAAWPLFVLALLSLMSWGSLTGALFYRHGHPLAALGVALVLSVGTANGLFPLLPREVFQGPEARLFLAALWDVLFLAVAETVSWVSMRTYRVS